MCHFNQTTSTEVQVTPAAAAQQSSPESQVPDEQAPVDDLTDDFAAGDAAVQVPVGCILVYGLSATYLNIRRDRLCTVAE